MNLKNALRLTFLNNNMILKSLIYRLFIFIIYAICSYFILKDFFLMFNNFALKKSFFYEVNDLIKFYFTKKFYKVALFILLSYVIGVLNNFADSSIVDILNNHMSILSREGFFGSFVRNFVLAITYGLLYTLFNLLFLSISLGLAYLIITKLYATISFFAIPLAIIVFVLLTSLKQTIISQILPYAVTNHCNVLKAIKNINIKQAFTTYSSYILAYSLIFYVNITAGILTLGAGLMLTLPLSFILLDILGLTSFYEINKMKYYITYDVKCIPKELRDNEENLLNEMNI